MKRTAKIPWVSILALVALVFWLANAVAGLAQTENTSGELLVKFGEGIQSAEQDMAHPFDKPDALDVSLHPQSYLAASGSETIYEYGGGARLSVRESLDCERLCGLFIGCPCGVGCCYRRRSAVISGSLRLTDSSYRIFGPDVGSRISVPDDRSYDGGSVRIQFTRVQNARLEIAKFPDRLDYFVFLNPTPSGGCATRCGEGIMEAQINLIGRRVVACTYAISPSSAPARPGGGAGSVRVTATPSGCRWTAASDVSWTTISSGASGSGDGTVTYSVAVNPSSSLRTGTLLIGRQAFAVAQHGVGGAIHVNRLYSGVELGTPSQPFRGINSANNFAWDGAQIRIRAGSYAEVLVFSKRLTISADGGPVTVGR